MQCLKNKVLATMLISLISLSMLTTPALAQDPRSEVSGEGMVFDFIILRPLGIVTTTAGCAFFLVTLPFTVWSSERIKQSGKCFIAEPAAYTFVRPLGDLRDISSEE